MPKSSEVDSVLGLSLAVEEGHSVDGVRPLKQPGELTPEQRIRAHESRGMAGWRKSRTAERKRFNRSLQSANAGKLRPVKTPEESAKTCSETGDVIH